MFRKIREYISSLPPVAIFSAGLVLLAMVRWLDYHTPPEVSLTVLYFIPIGFVSWFGGTRMGYGMAVLSAIATFQANWEVTLRYPSPTLHFWNGCVSLGVFFVVTALSNAIARLQKLKALEELAARTAQESSRFKSYVVSLVNHEFANSVTLLKGSLSFLRETDPERIPEKRQRSYEVMDRVISRLDYATVNFLNLNRLESGGFHPDIRKATIRPVIDKVLLTMAPLIQVLPVRLDVEVPSDLPAVRVDSDALGLVLTNLIHNAFKYTSEGGRVRIRAVGRAGSVEVSIQDTGIGISAEERERIFAGFYRSQGAKNVAEGFGVGLRVAYDLLKCQHVELKLESAPGKGSRFYFNLPVDEEPLEVHVTLASGGPAS